MKIRLPQTHYELLGVGERATVDEIKAAFRAKALEWHPDKHEGKPSRGEAEEKFKLFSNAQAILTDAGKRLMYDEQLRSASEGARRSKEARERSIWAENAAWKAARRAAASAEAEEAARAAAKSYEAARPPDLNARAPNTNQAAGDAYMEFVRAQRKKAGGLF